MSLRTFPHPSLCLFPDVFLSLPGRISRRNPGPTQRRAQPWVARPLPRRALGSQDKPRLGPGPIWLNCNTCHYPHVASPHRRKRNTCKWRDSNPGSVSRLCQTLGSLAGFDSSGESIARASAAAFSLSSRSLLSSMAGGRCHSCLKDHVDVSCCFF